MAKYKCSICDYQFQETNNKPEYCPECNKNIFKEENYTICQICGWTTAQNNPTECEICHNHKFAIKTKYICKRCSWSTDYEKPEYCPSCSASTILEEKRYWLCKICGNKYGEDKPPAGYHCPSCNSENYESRSEWQ